MLIVVKPGIVLISLRYGVQRVAVDQEVDAREPLAAGDPERPQRQVAQQLRRRLAGSSAGICSVATSFRYLFS